MKHPAKTALISVLVFTLFSGLCTALAAAAGTPAWSTVYNGKAVLYVPNAGDVSAMTAQVGTIGCETITQTLLSDQATPLKTTILVDNSLSIPKNTRPMITELLEDIVGNRMPGELFTISTVAEGINYLCQDTTDYSTLKTIIGAIHYQDQGTYLTDLVYDLLSDMKKQPSDLLQRVVIISDGADDKELGYTKEELLRLVQETGYPVYTVGCTNNTKTSSAALENLFAISRAGVGRSYILDQVEDKMALASELAEYNNSRKVEITLPPEVCDGASKGLRLTMQTADGQSQEYAVQLTMPFATPQASQPVQESAPAVVLTPGPIVEEEKEGFPVLAIVLIVVAALAVIGAIVAVVLRKPKPGPTPVPVPAPQPISADVTEALEEGQTENIWGPSGCPIVILTDVNDPKVRFEIPLAGPPVSIGRENCQVTIDPKHKSVSRHQCDISLENNRIMVRNQASGNITQLDGQKLLSVTELSSGSLLKMGSLTLKVEIRWP